MVNIRSKLRKKTRYKRLDKKVNNELKLLAELYRNDLINRITPAEKKFISIINDLNINLLFQYIIYIRSVKGRIKRFYIVDFCDTKNKIIFEIDGEYHYRKSQLIRDKLRSLNLIKEGYIIYRFTNKQVFLEIPAYFLRNIYIFKI